MRITSQSHPDDIKAMEFFRQKGLDVLQAAGATRTWAGPVNDSRGGAHNRGSCRMGNDPKTSVVNKFNQAHDVENLFVTDGASFVSNACQNPTLTMMAITARACDYAIGELRAARL